MGGPAGWDDIDRLLAMARRVHDDELCPSGAGPEHYRDECDEDSPTFTDPAPEPVESTCAWLVAAEEYAEEQGKAEVRERGLMVGWRDGKASAPSHDGKHDRGHEQREAGQEQDDSTEHEHEVQADGRLDAP